MQTNYMGSDSEKDKQPDLSVKETPAERKSRRRGRKGKRAAVEIPPVTVEGISIDDAVQKALGNDEGPTIIDQNDYVLEAGPEISIDDLPAELRDEVKFEQQFYELEHGAGTPGDLDDQEIDDPTPVNTPTMPAPAMASAMPILPAPLSNDHEVNLDGLDDDEPKVGIFQLPTDFTPAPEIIAATRAAASTQVGIMPPPSLRQTPIDPTLHDRETLAPPPQDQLSLLGDIVVTMDLDEKEEITQDLSEQAKLLWAFRESRFCSQYEIDMAYFQVHCLKDPQLERPNIKDYLDRFQKEQEKKQAK